MKKALKIILPIILVIAIIAGVGWYLFEYDREFTRDMLLHAARYYESQGDLETASWFYDRAYAQGSGSDEIAIELAKQYIESGNYTQAEVTLNKAIQDGGGYSLYITLCKTFVDQNKLLDAVDLLDRITDSTIKAEIDKRRPQLPASSQVQGFYNQYISVEITSDVPTLYVSSNNQYPSTDTDLYTQPITLQDGENVLYAIAVSEEGLVSPMAIFGYTVGGVIEEVIFTDHAIEQEVRSLLHVSDSKVLYSNDLWGITEFTIPENAVNYSDLRHMAYLETLKIHKGVSGQLEILSNFSMLRALHITDMMVSPDEIEIIGSMTGLQKLTLNNCNLSTVSDLEKLVALEYLDLGNNAIRNLTAISNMVKLRELYMPSNALQDISMLMSCTELKRLDVAYNSISTLAPITALEKLTYIDISHNMIDDISQVAILADLIEFRAAGNAITDLTSLTGCTKLSYLDISHNQLTAINAVSGLNNLTYLNFSNNAVTALPKWTSASRLVTIDGSYNQLSDISGLSVLVRLNNVFMDYNEKISSISALAKCPMLIQVNVYGTKVKEVSELTDQSIIVNYNPVQ